MSASTAFDGVPTATATNLADQSVTYGTDPATAIVVRIGDLPQSSLLALLKRGVSHYFGNEIAAKISEYRKGTRVKGPDGKLVLGDDGKPTYENAPTDEAVDAFQETTYAAFRDAMYGGTMGEGRGFAAPKPPPVERHMAAFAKADVQAILTANKLAFTKDAEGKRVVTIGGVPTTMETLVQRQIAKRPDHYRTLGEREVARLAKIAKDSAAKAGGLDDLMG